MKKQKFLSVLMLAVLVMPFAITGCSVFSEENIDSSSYPISDKDERRRTIQERGKLSGDGITIFGGDEDAGAGGAVGAGIGINSYLWRATLDTLSFMPLSQADPFGGVIITDWYQNPDVQDEQFKINVLILDQRLRTNALKVSVFRRVRDRNGAWEDRPASENVARDLEDKILTRARELRVASGE